MTLLVASYLQFEPENFTHVKFFELFFQRLKTFKPYFTRIFGI